MCKMRDPALPPDHKIIASCALDEFESEGDIGNAEACAQRASVTAKALGDALDARGIQFDTWWPTPLPEGQPPCTLAQLVYGEDLDASHHATAQWHIDCLMDSAVRASVCSRLPAEERPDVPQAALVPRSLNVLPVDRTSLPDADGSYGLVYPIGDGDLVVETSEDDNSIVLVTFPPIESSHRCASMHLRRKTKKKEGAADRLAVELRPPVPEGATCKPTLFSLAIDATALDALLAPHESESELERGGRAPSCRDWVGYADREGRTAESFFFGVPLVITKLVAHFAVSNVRLNVLATAAARRLATERGATPPPAWGSCVAVTGTASFMDLSKPPDSPSRLMRTAQLVVRLHPTFAACLCAAHPERPSGDHRTPGVDTASFASLVLSCCARKLDASTGMCPENHDSPNPARPNHEHEKFYGRCLRCPMLCVQCTHVIDGEKQRTLDHEVVLTMCEAEAVSSLVVATFELRAVARHVWGKKHAPTFANMVAPRFKQIHHNVASRYKDALARHRQAIQTVTYEHGPPADAQAAAIVAGAVVDVYNMPPAEVVRQDAEAVKLLGTEKVYSRIGVHSSRRNQNGVREELHPNTAKYRKDGALRVSPNMRHARNGAGPSRISLFKFKREGHLLSAPTAVSSKATIARAHSINFRLARLFPCANNYWTKE